MADVNQLAPGEVELGGLAIKTLRGNKPARLVLTNHRLFAHLNYGLFGQEYTSVPLRAVEAMFYGWRRQGWLLAAAIIAGFATLGAILQPRGGGAAIMFGFIALASFVVFWAYRPTAIRFQSGRESLEGRPSSQADAQAFLSLVLNQIALQQGGDE